MSLILSLNASFIVAAVSVTAAFPALYAVPNEYTHQNKQNKLSLAQSKLNLVFCFVLVLVFLWFWSWFLFGFSFCFSFSFSFS